jgi:hypothetical protein
VLAGMVEARLSVGRTTPPWGNFRDGGRRCWGKSPLLPAAGGGHDSGSPALRMPSKMGSSWAKNVGSALLAVQAARTRETV